MIKGGGMKYTFGSSKAAVNLMSNILEQEEFKPIRGKVLCNLSKQDSRLNILAGIKDKNVRETSLLMWHKRFATIIKDYPEVVRTHVLNVEAGIYRKLIKASEGD